MFVEDISGGVNEDRKDKNIEAAVSKSESAERWEIEVNPPTGCGRLCRPHHHEPVNPFSNFDTMLDDVRNMAQRTLMTTARLAKGALLYSAGRCRHGRQGR